MNSRLRAFLPLIVVFLIVNALLIAAAPLLEKWNVDRNVVAIGNLILFAVTTVSYSISLKGLNHSNPHRFTRSIYSGIMIKLFLSMIAALIYIMTLKSELNKSGLFICMGLYLVYSMTEVMILTKLLKRRPQNA
jgi:hypothetical protein